MCWDILDKIATIGTIIGIPVVLYTSYEIIVKGIVVYDMFREPNEAGGMTINIGNYCRKDYRNGKKQNPEREYHKKGFPDDDKSWE